VTGSFSRRAQLYEVSKLLCYVTNAVVTCRIIKKLRVVCLQKRSVLLVVCKNENAKYYLLGYNALLSFESQHTFRLTFNGLHDVILRKIVLFITTAAATSNSTCEKERLHEKRSYLPDVKARTVSGSIQSSRNSMRATA
jgi:hypothetical protein